MAVENSKDVAKTIAPFYATSDDVCRTRTSLDGPVAIINPEASALDLWQVAEARLMNLEKLLSILVCTSECGIEFSPADYAEVFKPRVDEILCLATEANRLAAEARRPVAASVQ